MKNKKKTPRKTNRILAVFLAVLVLATVAIIPASAVVGEEVVPSSGTVTINSPTTGITQGRQEQYTVTLADLKGYSPSRPYVMTYTDILLGCSSNVHYSLVSFEAAFPTGHYSIQFYRTGASDIYQRMGKYTDSPDDFDDFTMEEAIGAGKEKCVSYSLYYIQEDLYLTCDYYVIGNKNELKVHKTRTFVIDPAECPYITFAVKCYDASVDCDYIGGGNSVAHSVPVLIQYQNVVDNMKYEVAQSYAKGFADGEVEGYYNAHESGEIVTKGIWDVLSMPFTLIASILNFEVFGINMWVVVTSLMTIGLVVFVLKKVGVF